MNNKTNINDQNTKKNSFLIIRLSSIGDVVLTSHLIRCIRNTYPNATIDYLIFDHFKDILKNNIRLDDVFYFNKNEYKSGQMIIKSDSSLFFNINNYDYIIDLQKNKYSRKLTSEANCQLFKINKQRIHKLSLVYLKKSILKDFSIPLNYLKSVANLNITDDGMGLEFWLDGENEYPSFNLKKKNLKISNIAIAPGAAHKTKQLPYEKMIEIINLLKVKYNCDISLLGGKNEIEIGKRISTHFNNSLINYCGKKSILETAEIIDKCDLLITNDTGLMHIAAARQTPIISFFGSSVKEFGFVPFRCKSKIIETNIWCRPCSHIGRSFCPLLHFKCMNSIDTENVIVEIQKLLA